MEDISFRVMSDILSPSSWNWRQLSKNIPIQEIRDNTHLPWNKQWLSRNPGITMGDIDILSNASGIWPGSTLTEYLPIEDIRANTLASGTGDTTLPESWDRFHLSSNVGITIEDVKYLDNVHGIWNWALLSENLPIQDIRDTLGSRSHPWDKYGLCGKLGLTLEDVCIWGKDEWPWYSLSQNMPIEDIRKNMSLPWIRSALTLNRGITMKDVISWS